MLAHSPIAAHEPTLAQLEAVICDGLAGFYQAGQALAMIRDRKLYKPEYATLEEYCRARWRISYRRAAELMSAASVVAQLPPNLEPPKNENQARPLTRLDNPIDRAVAWRASLEISPRPSGADVQRSAMALSAPTVAVGDRRVVLGRSEFAGQNVEVLAIDGVVAKCQTAAGVVPFLRSELEAAPEPAKLVRKPVPTDRFEGLAVALEQEQARTEALEQMLGKVCAAARSNSITEALLQACERLL